MRRNTPGGGVNRVKVGFFSVSDRGGSDDDADDRAYLAWHQLDHMPEQYQLPGMIHGQRWVSNDGCRAARSTASGVFEDVHHVVLYLMGEPVEQTLDDFFDLGSRLAHLGRFPRDLPRRFLGALRLLEARASPRVFVSAEVVPFRPNRGIFLIVEQPADRDRLDPYCAGGTTSTWPDWSTRPGSPGRGCSPPRPAIGVAATPRVTSGSRSATSTVIQARRPGPSGR